MAAPARPLRVTCAMHHHDAASVRACRAAWNGASGDTLAEIRAVDRPKAARGGARRSESSWLAGRRRPSGSGPVEILARSLG